MKSELEEKAVHLQEAEKKYSRKVTESREERELDAQAKKHLQETYSDILEEKEEKLRVLQTQVGRESGSGKCSEDIVEESVHVTLYFFWKNLQAGKSGTIRTKS